ncbi:MAG: TldD/PmbA family protein [Candidatus Woesearchaeota archaeon]
MNFEEAAEFALEYALKKKVEYADVRAEERFSEHYAINNGILSNAVSSQESGIGVRLFKKTFAFFSTNKLEKQNIKKLIDSALRGLDRTTEKQEIKIGNYPAHKKSYSAKERIKILNLNVKEKINCLEEVEEHTKDVALNRFYSLSDSLVRKLFLNSEGARIRSYIPRVSFYYIITISENSKTAQHFWQYGASSGYEAFNRWNLKTEIRNLALALKANLRYGKKIKKGIMDVVVAPQVTGIIVHESCGHPYEADRILGREAAQAGESFVKREMLGTRIGSVAANIADDPTIKNSFGFFLYDDEGVKARRKILMKNGLINEFLHNKESASLFNTKSNGSARSKTFEHEPIVRMSNTFMIPGDYKEEELIEGVKNGVYIKNFMEWNIDDRRLNQKYVGAEAYMIKNGKITTPVRNPILEIITPELYSKIDAVADNIEFHAGSCGKGEPMQAIPVWFGGPSFRIRNLLIK